MEVHGVRKAMERRKHLKDHEKLLRKTWWGRTREPERGKTMNRRLR